MVKIFRLMTRDPHYEPGSDKKEAAEKFGSGPLFRVFCTVLGRIAAGNEKRDYDIDTVIERSAIAGLIPLFYIDEKQDEERQTKCVQACIDEAKRRGLTEIGIFSPRSELLAEARKIKAKPLKVKTGRLAGHSQDWRQEIEKEAANGSSIIVFYAYEHTDEIKPMIKFARKHNIAIMFNIRDKDNHERDLMSFAKMILKMTAKRGGGILCNYPQAAMNVF